MLLAQLADLFDQTTWLLIFVIGLGAPLLGFFFGWIIRGVPYARQRWKYVAVYYGLAGFFFLALSAQESLVFACPFYLLLLAGPILGVCLAVAGPKRAYPDGFCMQCGYDLRASTERCPECGTSIAPHADSSHGT